MMLPILISVSVAPGSYFFCACALPAIAIASSEASATDLAKLKTWLCIIVLPELRADGLGGHLSAALPSRRIDAVSVCLNHPHCGCRKFEVPALRAAAACPAIFRQAEGFAGAKKAQRRSNAAIRNRARCLTLREGSMSMNPAQRALWFIESNLAEDISLDDIAG